jgi:DNA-directed RNA polymerase specialized sigma54-like protein
MCGTKSVEQDILNIVNEIKNQVIESIHSATQEHKIGTLCGIDVYVDDKLKDGEWYIKMNQKTLENITKPYRRD